MTSGYLFIDTAAALEDAINVLLDATSIVLDCEGDNLGDTNGRLSLVGCRVGGQSFLIDMISIPQLMFDGRSDFTQLCVQHSIHVRGVLDMQLVDVISRALRGEDADDQLDRLSPYLYRKEVQGQKGSYRQIHRLSGLEACLKEHGLEGKKTNCGEHTAWMQRPLDSTLMAYLHNDLVMVETLYKYFEEKRYITSQLAAQSQRYVELWQRGKPAKGTNHPLLPSNILDHRYGRKRCNTCQRDLPNDCFSKVGQRLTAKPLCWVCRAVSVITHIRSNWEDEDNTYEGYDSSDFEGFRSSNSLDFYDYDSDL